MRTFDFKFWLSIILYLVIVSVVCCFPYWLTDPNRYSGIDFTQTGQIGDTIGGIMGPFIAIFASLLTFFAFWVQYKANLQQREQFDVQLQLQKDQFETQMSAQKAQLMDELTQQKQSDKEQERIWNIERFEDKYYELLRLHRENVKELRYIKFENEEMTILENRKVFRTITKEFIECYQDVRRFVKMYPEMEILKDEYKHTLETIRQENKCRADVLELALIDLSFTILYYGLSIESETVLIHKFYHRYNKAFTHRLRTFLQLKPKKENKSAFDEWIRFRGRPVNEIHNKLEKIFDKVESRRVKDIKTGDPLLMNIHAEKYYGGHQHRLGHYLRHLFQAFKFISQQPILSDDEKYFYAKTLRTQLSTYEQLLIFFNSLSSLGMMWEYTPDVPSPLRADLQEKDFKLITRYNLIKNLPGSQFYDFSYRQFYRDVVFDYVEDITYQNNIP